MAWSSQTRCSLILLMLVFSLISKVDVIVIVMRVSMIVIILIRTIRACLNSMSGNLVAVAVYNSMYELMLELGSLTMMLMAITMAMWTHFLFMAHMIIIFTVTMTMIIFFTRRIRQNLSFLSVFMIKF